MIRCLMLVLLVILVLPGCSAGTRPDSEVDVWAGLDLPEAAYAPSIIDMMPTTMKIGLREKQCVTIYTNDIAIAELSDLLKARYKKYGEFPVVIGANASLPFNEVWSVVKSCREAGLWRINFAVYVDKTMRLISCLDFSAPVRMGTAAKGPVVIKDPDNSDILSIQILKDGYVFLDNGKVLDLNDAYRQLQRMGSFSNRITILCVPDPDITHGGVVQLLNICRESGLRNLSIMSSEEFGMKVEGSSSEQ